MKKNIYLITGSAGFIGYHLAKFLLQKKNIVVGIDNIKGFYDDKIKSDRVKILKKYKNFKFYKKDVADIDIFLSQNEKKNIKVIFHLAAQPGVRLSEKYSDDYLSRNLISYLKILHFTSKNKIPYFFYASSSSVYGDHKLFPLKENQNLIPKNIYSFSKKNNEDIARIYHDTYGLNSVGLRFFTVYGEWGRPDMLMIKYLIAKKNKKNFILNNKGNHFRDFTYIEDVTNILTKLILSKNKKKSVYNICSNKPISVKSILKKLDKLYGKPNIIYEKKLAIEVLKTHGSNSEIKKITKFKNFTKIDKGIQNLVFWAKQFLNKI